MNPSFIGKDIYSAKTNLQNLTTRKKENVVDLIFLVENVIHNCAERCRDLELLPKQYYPACKDLIECLGKDLQRYVMKEVSRRLKSKNLQLHKKNHEKFDFINRYKNDVSNCRFSYMSISLGGKSIKRFTREDSFGFWYKLVLEVNGVEHEINLPVKMNKNIKRLEKNKKMNLLNVIRLDLDLKGNIYLTLIYAKHKTVDNIRGEIIAENILTSKNVMTPLTNKKEIIEELTKTVKNLEKKNCGHLVLFFGPKLLRYIKKNKDKIFSTFASGFNSYIKLLLRKLRSHGISYDIPELAITNVESIHKTYKYWKSPLEYSSRFFK